MWCKSNVVLVVYGGMIEVHRLSAQRYAICLLPCADIFHLSWYNAVLQRRDVAGTFVSCVKAPKHVCMVYGNDLNGCQSFCMVSHERYGKAQMHSRSTNDWLSTLHKVRG